MASEGATVCFGHDIYSLKKEDARKSFGLRKMIDVESAEIIDLTFLDPFITATGLRNALSWIQGTQTQDLIEEQEIRQTLAAAYMLEISELVNSLGRVHLDNRSHTPMEPDIPKPVEEISNAKEAVAYSSLTEIWEYIEKDQFRTDDTMQGYSLLHRVQSQHILPGLREYTLASLVTESAEYDQILKSLDRKTSKKLAKALSHSEEECQFQQLRECKSLYALEDLREWAAAPGFILGH